MAENQPPTTPRDPRAQAKADKAYQKAQRPWYKKKRFLIPLILIVLILIFVIATTVSGGGGGGGGNTDMGNPYGGAEETGGTAQTSEPTADTGGAFPGATEDDVVGQPGSAVTVGDMTVTSTPLVAADFLGQPYLCTSVSLTNGADETVDYSIADWQLQNPAGAIANSTFGGSDIVLPTGQLVPGGTATGDVCFNNDSGAAGQYVVLYKPFTAFAPDRAAWINTL